LTARRIALGLWLLAVTVAAGMVASGRVTSDASVFLPAGASAEQRLILDDMRRGAASRVLLIAVERSDDARGAAERLRARLADTGRFELVATRPDPGALAAAEQLFRYRYLLSDRVTAGAFEADALEPHFRDLTERLRGGWVDERRAAADPTGEFRHVLRQILGSGTQGGGAWNTTDGRPVILAVPRAEPYALDAQASLIDDIRAAAAELQPAAEVTISGAPAIAVATRDTIRSEATRVSLLAGIAVLAVLGYALRSLRALVLCLLAPASGLLLGVAAVVAVFGQVHGITLAFAATLLGMTVDYPLHLVWRGRGEPLPRAARAIGRALLAGAGSSALGFAALGLAEFPGLQQLALLTTVGIVTAAAVTRWVLPRLVVALPAGGAPAPRARMQGQGMPRWLGVVAALALAASGVAVTGVVTLGTDLSALSPVPEALRERDRALRDAVGVGAPRYAVRVTGATREQALQRTEALTRVLTQARQAGELAHFRAPTAAMPSTATQRVRRAALPPAPQLRAAVNEAVSALPLRPRAFEPFVESVAASRQLSPLVPDALPSGFLRQWLEGHLFPLAGGWTAVVSLAGMQDAAAVAERIAPLDGAAFLDRVEITNAMVTHYQTEAVSHFALGSLLILATLALTLRDARRVGRVVLVVAGAVGATLTLHALIAPTLSLFAVVSLLLVVGLGIDYAVFAGSGEAAARGSVTVCAVTTVAAFALLATADVPVLRDIGLTVAVGTAFAWLLAQGLAPAAAADSS
jgi:predicted exporter